MYDKRNLETNSDIKRPLRLPTRPNTASLQITVLDPHTYIVPNGIGQARAVIVESRVVQHQLLHGKAILEGDLHARRLAGDKRKQATVLDHAGADRRRCDHGGETGGASRAAG